MRWRRRSDVTHDGGSPAAIGTPSTNVMAMFVIFVMLWFGFILGSFALGIVLVITTIHMLSGRPASVPTLGIRHEIAVITVASACALVYAIGMWASFPPDDANRLAAATPAAVFGVMGLLTAAGIASSRRHTANTTAAVAD